MIVKRSSRSSKRVQEETTGKNHKNLTGKSKKKVQQSCASGKDRIFQKITAVSSRKTKLNIKAC